MSYRNALFRKGLEVLSSEGIGGNEAKKLVNEAFNDNQQSYRQLSLSAGRLLNLIPKIICRNIMLIRVDNEYADVFILVPQ